MATVCFNFVDNFLSLIWRHIVWICLSLIAQGWKKYALSSENFWLLLLFQSEGRLAVIVMFYWTGYFITPVFFRFTSLNKHYFYRTAWSVPQIYLLHYFRKVDSLDASIYAEIRTRIPDTMPWDYNFEPAGTNPLTFTVKVCHEVLISPCVTFRCCLTFLVLLFFCFFFGLLMHFIPPP